MTPVTVDICTKDRYADTLPLTLVSVATQTVTPDELFIYDDSTNRQDMGSIEHLRYALELLSSKGIRWQVVWGQQRGQHIGHQFVQEHAANDLIWRIDDDEVAEPKTLEVLLENMTPGIGAVAGLVLSPGAPEKFCAPNTILSTADNCQWYRWSGTKECEHLYSSYLYRKGIHDFDMFLSPVAHREETLHTFGIFAKGHKLIVDSRAVTWHFRSSKGGIRTGVQENWWRDEVNFQEVLNEHFGKKICFLDSGKGDHLVFRDAVLPKLKEKYKEIVLAVCHPELFPGEKTISIAEGYQLCNPSKHNVYEFGGYRKWTRELKYAYAEMYGVQI
jgi:hypothetical protein